MNPPHPIRTAKLSIVGPVQYYCWGQSGNHRCWRASIIFYFLKGFFLKIFRTRFSLNRTLVFRSYHDEPTASHQNCEVKHRWAGSVLLLGTKWESPVLKGINHFLIFSKRELTLQKKHPERRIWTTDQWIAACNALYSPLLYRWATPGDIRPLWEPYMNWYRN